VGDPDGTRVPETLGVRDLEEVIEGVGVYEGVLDRERLTLALGDLDLDGVPEAVRDFEGDVDDVGVCDDVKEGVIDAVFDGVDVRDEPDDDVPVFVGVYVEVTVGVTLDDNDLELVALGVLDLV
jgi:hypothetical protein